MHTRKKPTTELREEMSSDEPAMSGELPQTVSTKAKALMTWPVVFAQKECTKAKRRQICNSVQHLRSSYSARACKAFGVVGMPWPMKPKRIGCQPGFSVLEPRTSPLGNSIGRR